MDNKIKIQIFISCNIVYIVLHFPLELSRATVMCPPVSGMLLKVHCYSQLYFLKRECNLVSSRFHLKINFKMNIDHRAYNTAKISFPENYRLFMVSHSLFTYDAYSSSENGG